MPNGGPPMIEVNVSIVDHNGDGLQGFYLYLYNWGTSALLGEGDVPNDGSAICITTEAFDRGAGKVVLQGPATQRHTGIRNYAQVTPISLRHGHDIQFVMENCPDIEGDAYSGPLSPVDEPEIVGADLAEAEEAPDYRLGCTSITISAKDTRDSGRTFQAQPNLHGSPPLCDVKTLASGITGTHIETFAVRKTSTTCYLRVWPSDDPTDVLEFVLKGLKAPSKFKVAKIGSVWRIHPE